MSNLKRFLALTLAMLMVVGAMAVSAKSFTDVASTDSYAEAVDVLSELGVIAGTSTDEFSPDALVERQQMAMFIARLATAQPSWFAVEAPAVFADQKDPGYNAAIAYASTNGFVKGTDTAKNLFDGTASVTLQEAATMLCRVLGYTTDAMDKAYPMSYLTMADDVGLLAGLEDVAPTAALTRGEVAIMLYNAFKAPMATTYLTSNSTGGVVVNVSIPDDLSKAKTLMEDKWKVAKVSSYIAATKDFRFTGSSVKTSKTLTDPVKLNGVADQVSFSTIVKFFPEDAIANDYLGVDLNVFIRNNKIISIDVLGDKLTTTAATWNNDTKTVTVEGSAYDLDAYPIDANYPSETDNCFYTYIDSVITKIDAPAKVDAIANGFFSIEILNGGKDTQKIVFKPYQLGKVIADSNADGILEIETIGNITNNAAKAVAGDYVVFFKGGANLVETISVATKSAAVKVSKINITANTATLADGTVAPAATPSTKIPGPASSFTALALGDSTFYIYSVNGVVVRTESATVVSTAYAPKSYYQVVAHDTLSNAFNGYRIKIVDASGAVTVIAVTEIDGVAIDDVADIAALAGNVITLDGGKVYTNAGVAADFSKYYSVPAKDGTYDETATVTDAVNNSGTIFTIGTTTPKSFVLTDYSKIVVYSANDKAYKAFSGKNFNGFADTALTDYIAIVHNNGTFDELVYLYATVAGASGVEKGAVVASANPYLFLSVDSYDAKTVTYNVFKLATGAKEQVTFSDSTTYSNITAVTDGKMAGTSLVYDVQSTVKLPDELDGTIKGTFKVSDTGYISKVGGAVYSTSGTKFYKWNGAADKLTYEAVAFADVSKTTYYKGIVVADSYNNAVYVIFQSEDTVAGLTATVAPATTDGKVVAGNTITIATTTATATIKYTLDGTDPSTSATAISVALNSFTYTVPAVATAPVGSTITIKVIASSTNMNSTTATFTYVVKAAV